LWFACQEPVDLPAGFSRSGVVLALNITAMPRFKTLSTTATYAAHASPLSYQLQEALDAGEPFVVESLTPNDRIRAQEGFFVAGATPDPPAGADQTPFRAFTYPAESGTPSKDLEELLLGSRGRGAPATMLYVAVIIRAQLKAKLLEYLQVPITERPGCCSPTTRGSRPTGRRCTQGVELRSASPQGTARSRDLCIAVARRVPQDGRRAPMRAPVGWTACGAGRLRGVVRAGRGHANIADCPCYRYQEVGEWTPSRSPGWCASAGRCAFKTCSCRSGRD